MIASEGRSLSVHRRAVAWSLAALASEAQVDKKLPAEQRTKLEAERQKLVPHAVALRDAERALEDHDLGVGMEVQAAVSLGDEYLDAGVSAAVEQTRRELRDQPGLGAEHVFGAHVGDIVRAPLAEEPGLVLAAVDRLDDVPEFPAKPSVKADLTERATDQETRLHARDAAERVRAKLAGQAAKAATDAVTALHELKGTLGALFPRRRKFVGRFFLAAPAHTAVVQPPPLDAPPTK